MAAMTMRNSCMVELLARLEQDFTSLSFVAGNRFCWSPAKREVMYKRQASGPVATYSLLHETAHALLAHKRYSMDFELLALEVDAWERARGLSKRYSVVLDEDHIQDCLDTYRDWLYRRSICPTCTTKALQLDGQPVYRCYNCLTSWRVANSRFCRPYRKRDGTVQSASTIFASQL